MKSLHGRKRWRITHERGRHGALALRDYLETLRPLADSLVEAVCALDQEYRVAYANASMLRLLGSAEADLLGRRVDDLIRCGANLHELLDAHQSRELGPCDLRRGDGASMLVRCLARAIVANDHPLGVMLIVTRPGAPADVDANDSESAPPAHTHLSAIERRVRVVDAVSEIALASHTLDELLQALLECLRREMDLENIAIFLVNDEGDKLVGRAASGAGAEIAYEIRVPLEGTMIGQAMSGRRAIFVPDVNDVATQWVYFTPEMRARMDVRSFVMAPLVVEQRLIGSIYLGASQPNRFTSADARLAELVGERAALAIERARASDAAARAHQRLRFLNDASGALTETLDYHDATQRLARILAPALADACAIYLLEDDGLLRRVAMQSPPPAVASDAGGMAMQQLVEQIGATPEINPDDETNDIARCIETLTPIYARRALGESVATCLCMPMVVRQHALGGICLVFDAGRELSDGDLALVQGLAERAAIAVDNARLYSETEQALASGSAIATQLDTIFNATDVGIFVTDASGDYLRVNPYGAQLLGLEQDPLTGLAQDGHVVFEMRTTEGEPIARDDEPIQRARMQGQHIEQRYVIHRFDTGKDIQALTRCTPWRDDRHRIAGAIAVVTDITAISELERQKDEFLGVASHELKTPLTSLKILAQLLARKMEASGEQRELEQAQRMQVAITRMERLISDLLDVSLIQEGKLALHEELIDLGVIAAEAVNEQRILTQRDIRYEAAHGLRLPIYADRERIYQVVSNLLSNALKYSPNAEPVTVRARAAKGECIVTVHDHGSGVPPEALEHIFERFFRVPGMQVQSGSGVGLGLGLHISKDIVTRHGGRIWVESRLGHGSDFSIAFPRADHQPNG